MGKNLKKAYKYNEILQTYMHYQIVLLLPLYVSLLRREYFRQNWFTHGNVELKFIKIGLSTQSFSR